MIPRPRLFVILGVVGCALTIVLRESPAALAVLAAVVVIATISGLLAVARMVEIRRRPAAFTVSGGRFIARLVFPPDLFAMVMFVLLGMQIGLMVRNFQDPDPVVQILGWVEFGVVVFIGTLTVAFAVLVWSMATAGVELTPEGVMTRTVWVRRTIPWESLATGGPLRPGPRDARIRLVFDRPELVRRRGFRLPGRGDWITTQVDMHPWLVADAIRWYVEHPEHRAAIGTEAEHARLIAALGAGGPVVSTPEQPPAVRGAIRFAYAGAVFGPLTAIADVVLVFAFSDRLKAHAVEVGEREVREFGVEPSDWASGVLFTQFWHVAALVLIGLAAAVAVLSIRFLKQGNQVGRVALIVVSAAAVVWALVPCFEVAGDPPPGLQALFLTVAVVKRLGYLAFGGATLAFLLAPSVHVFTQPRPA